MSLQMKRIYEESQPADGIRILVDRLWPRGITREKVTIDEWLKELAPSDNLRKWYAHKPERWKEFAQRYKLELRSAERKEMISQLRLLARKKKVTLLFAAKDEEHSNAKVLYDLINR